MLLYRIKSWWYHSSSTRYIKYLRAKGAQIGDNVSILAPRKSTIDEGRASWLSIGSNTIVSSGCAIMCHDYSWSILRKSHNIIAPTGGGHVHIGDNCFLGINTIILRNVTIGNNVIIGAGSVVSKSIPANSVAAGNPAKVIMTLDEFCDKRKKTILQEAVREAKHLIALNNGKEPEYRQMLRFACLFRSESINESELALLKSTPVLGDNIDAYIDTLKKQSHPFSSFAEFLKYVQTINYSGQKEK